MFEVGPIKDDEIKPQSLFDELPIEIKQHIFSYLPAYSLVGKNALNNVNHVFNTTLKNIQEKRTPQKSIAGIIKSVRNESDAMAILSDEGLRKQLPISALFAMVGKIPYIAKQILEQYGEKLSTEDLNIIINQHNEAVAEYVLELPQLWDKLNEDSLLGDHHPFIAARIIHTPVLYAKFKNRILVCSAEKNLCAAEDLLRNPTSINLKGCYLARLGVRYQSIAEYILDTPALCENLSSADLVLMGKRYQSIARRILDSALRDKLYSHELNTLGESDELIAEHIVNTPVLWDKLNGCLFSWCERYPSMMERILNTPALRGNLWGTFLAYIGSRNQGIATQILDTPELRNKLSGTDLANLGERNLAIAKRILETPELAKHLESHGGYNLANLGAYDLSIALTIFDTPQLRNSLDSRALARLGSRHQAIAERILATPELRNMLNGRDLAVMGACHHAIIEHILTTPELRDKLDADNLVTLWQRYPILAERIVKTPTLCAKFAKVKNTCFFMFWNNYFFAKHIIENKNLYTRDLELSKVQEIETRLAIFDEVTLLVEEKLRLENSKSAPEQAACLKEEYSLDNFKKIATEASFKLYTIL